MPAFIPGLERHCVPVWQIFLYLRALDDPATFADGMADRLFDIHIFTGLNRPDGAQRVPVIGRRDADDVDALVVQQIANVGDERGLALLPFRHFFHAFLTDFLVRVTDVEHLGVLAARKRANVTAAAPANTDDGHSQLFAGALAFLFRPLQDLRCRTDGNRSRRGEHGIFEELTTIAF
jgi:hypothetical protein